MSANIVTIRRFYAALAASDAPQALGLMSEDIDWTTMWQYKTDGRGPQKVAEGILMPLSRDWRDVSLTPSEYIAQRDTVVSVGTFSGIYHRTGKKCLAQYAHVWTLADGRITHFRQYIDTLAVAEAAA